MVSIKAGSGIVIARDEEGKWACPSAIATAGLGAGLSIGAEVEELLIKTIDKFKEIERNNT